MPKHPHNALSPIAVRNKSEPGRYADGNGLYLLVDPNGAKRWILRTVIHSKRTDMGLGSVRLVTLADARKRAAEHRGIARDGGDPIALRRESSRTVPTFQQAAEAVHAGHSESWNNAKHRDQWINTLTAYVFPELGAKRVNLITSADVLRVLTPIWLSKPETARRVLQRIRTVLDWAKAAGHRAGDNPVQGVAKGLPKHTERRGHFTALPYADVPAFVTALHASGAGGVAQLAFEFLILNASRTGEVLGAKWSEIDTAKALWTIPADRMKSKLEHRVPLSKRALELLKATGAANSNPKQGFIFAGRKPSEPLSNMAFLMTLRRMGYDVTAHGFRSAFRDWAAERTNFPREVCEGALAHINKNKVEAAYLRSDLFEQRRALMGQWAQYVCTPAKRGKVVRLQRSKPVA
jgi:integrase